MELSHDKKKKSNSKNPPNQWVSIQTYDKDWNLTNDPERAERLNNLAQDEVLFLIAKYSLDDSMLMERYAFLDAVEWDTNDHESTAGTVAYVQRQSQQLFERDGKQFIPSGIHFDDRLPQHKLAHEMLHGLSSKIDIEYDKDGHGYIKNGIRLVLVDKDKGVIQQDACNMLNEGITEYLASQFDQQHQVFQNREYEQYRDLADMLTGGKDQSLIQAYFSDCPHDVTDFLQKFEAEQNFCSADDLLYLHNDGILSQDILDGCAQYVYRQDPSSDNKNRIVSLYNAIAQRNLEIVR